jgi:hypothetical protein
VRFQLQRDIAEGHMSRGQLAKKYGATVSGIRDFEKRHAAVVEKEQRVASYMADVELVEAETARVLDDRESTIAKATGGAIEADEDGEMLDAQLTVATDLGRLSRIKHRALRSVAEELGQLPTRMVVKNEGGGAVHVYGSGVDTEKV